MKKKFLNCTFIFALLVTLLVFSGCSDLSQADCFLENQICEVNGSVLQEDFSSRAAFPTLNASNYSYKIKAWQDDEASAKTVSTTSKNFSMSLKYGTWNFKAEVIYGGKVILVSSKNDVVLSSSETQIKFDSFSISTATTGTVSIKFNVGSGSAATKVIAVWNELNGTERKQTLILSSNNRFTMTYDGDWSDNAGNITPGNYKVFFYIRNSAGATIGVIVENIVVYSGLTTNRFVNTSMQYVNASGEIILAKDMEFQERTNYFVSATGNDNGTGSKISPFKTIQQAVNNIEAINDGSTEYTITLSGDISAGAGEGSYVSGLDTNKTLVKINPSKALKLKIAGEVSGTINGATGLRCFYIGDYASVSLENIIVTGFDDTITGSGIYLNGSCVVSGTTRFGNEVYLPEGKTVEPGTSLIQNGTNPVATLTFPENAGEYSENRNVLSGENISGHYNKFAVKNDSSGNSYHIASDGTLKKGDDIVVYTDWDSLKSAVEGIAAGTTEVTEFKVKGNIDITSSIVVSCPVKISAYENSSVVFTRKYTGNAFDVKATFEISGSSGNKIVFEGDASVTGYDYLIKANSNGSLNFEYVNIQNMFSDSALIYLYDYSLSHNISHCTFTNNECSGSDGCVIYSRLNDSNDKKLEISYCSFTNNTGEYGVGIFADTESFINISNSTFENNVSTSTSNHVGVAFYLSKVTAELDTITMKNNCYSTNKTEDLFIEQFGSNTSEVILKGKNTIDNLCYYLGNNCSGQKPLYLNNISNSDIGLTVDYFSGKDYSSSQVVALADGVTTPDLASQISCFYVLNEGKTLNDSGYLVDSSNINVLSLMNGNTTASDSITMPAFDSSKTYTISTEAELRQIGLWTKTNVVTANFELSKNISLNCIDGDESTYFTPIGSVKAFKGTFDGKNHTVSGMIVNTNSYAGLFGVLNSATVKNLKVEGSVTGSSTNGTGGIAGYLYVSSVISDCVSKVTVSSSKGCTGGICGVIGSGKVINCINIGSVDVSVSGASGIGGITGNMSSSSCSVINCANLGTITGNASVGGIVGSILNGYLQNCYNAGNVSSNNGSDYGAITGSGISSNTEESLFYLENSCSKAFGTDESNTATQINESAFTTFKTLQTVLDTWITSNDAAGTLYKKWKDTYTYNMSGTEYPVCVDCN